MIYYSHVFLPEYSVFSQGGTRGAYKPFDYYRPGLGPDKDFSLRAMTEGKTKRQG